MRAIGQVLWLFNCWTFRVSFVVYTDSFVGSTWASDSDLGRSWRPGGLSYVLGSGVSKIFAWMFVLCSVGASRRCYLGTSDSHLLLSWAGSGWCDMTPDIGQTQLRLSLLRRESRAAVLPSPLVLLDNVAFDSIESRIRPQQIEFETLRFGSPSPSPELNHCKQGRKYLPSVKGEVNKKQHRGKLSLQANEQDINTFQRQTQR